MIQRRKINKAFNETDFLPDDTKEIEFKEK